MAGHRRFDVTEYGAQADGRTLCTDSVQRAIDDCHANGGGVAGGVAALGIAVVALLKKKEDNE